jgi:hypothetical protein
MNNWLASAENADFTCPPPQKHGFKIHAFTDATAQYTPSHEIFAGIQLQET